MPFWFCIQQIVEALFSCCHHHAQPTEGKTYCPDCGCGLIFKWVVIRCQSCGQRRAGQYRFRTVIPADTCCTFCGDNQWIHQELINPEFYQLHYAMLSMQVVKVNIDHSVWTMAFVQSVVKNSRNISLPLLPPLAAQAASH